MWMPPHTTRPPGRSARSARGTSAPSGAKMIAASSATGGSTSEGPARSHPAPARELLRDRVPRPRKHIHLPALPARHLDQDVGSGTEPVQADPVRVPAEAQRAKADKAGAQQWRGLLGR